MKLENDKSADDKSENDKSENDKSENDKSENVKLEKGKLEKLDNSSKKRYKQKYKMAWEDLPEFKNWISKSTKDFNYAYCKPCDMDVNASGGKVDLLKHSKSKKHMKNGMKIGLWYREDDGSEMVDEMKPKRIRKPKKIEKESNELEEAITEMENDDDPLQNNFPWPNYFKKEKFDPDISKPTPVSKKGKFPPNLIKEQELDLYGREISASLRMISDPVVIGRVKLKFQELLIEAIVKDKKKIKFEIDESIIYTNEIEDEIFYGIEDEVEDEVEDELEDEDEFKEKFATKDSDKEWKIGNE